MKTNPHKKNGKGEVQCTANDLILVDEGVQCSRCMVLVTDRRVPDRMTQQRAKEIFDQAVNQSQHGPWSDQLRSIMTEDERDDIKKLWDTMPGYTCFVDAFLRVVHGRAVL